LVLIHVKGHAAAETKAAAVLNRNDHQPHAKRPRRASVQSQIETNGEDLSCARGSRLSRLSDAWGPGGGAPKGKKNGNFRHGGRTKEATSASRYINELARLLRSGD
jgi:hypothetical protein